MSLGWEWQHAHVVLIWYVKQWTTSWTIMPVRFLSHAIAKYDSHCWPPCSWSLHVLLPSPHWCFIRLFCHEKHFQPFYNSLQSLLLHLTIMTPPDISGYVHQCNMHASYVHVMYVMSNHAATILRCGSCRFVFAITALPRHMSTRYVEKSLHAWEHKYMERNTYILFMWIICSFWRAHAWGSLFHGMCSKCFQLMSAVGNWKCAQHSIALCEWFASSCISLLSENAVLFSEWRTWESFHNCMRVCCYALMLISWWQSWAMQSLMQCGELISNINVCDGFITHHSLRATRQYQFCSALSIMLRGRYISFMRLSRAVLPVMIWLPLCMVAIQNWDVRAKCGTGPGMGISMRSIAPCPCNSYGTEVLLALI